MKNGRAILASIPKTISVKKKLSLILKIFREISLMQDSLIKNLRWFHEIFAQKLCYKNSVKYSVWHLVLQREIYLVRVLLSTACTVFKNLKTLNRVLDILSWWNPPTTYFQRKVDLKISRKICRTGCQTLHLHNVFNSLTKSHWSF